MVSFLQAPYVNCKIESGKFFIATDKAYDMKLLYQQILQEAGCKSEFGFTDEVGQGESTFTFWLIRGGAHWFTSGYYVFWILKSTED